MPVSPTAVNDTNEVEIVFDLEADGFRDEATQVWCICLKELGLVAPVEEYGPGPFDMYPALERLSEATHLIGHNIINYDLPLLKRLYGWEPSPGCRITDTVVYSRVLKSDRALPSSAPGNLPPHSLAAWGYRVGRGKPDHSDWSQFSPEMLHRCSEDVEINVLTYEQLIREEQSDPSVDWSQALELEHAIAHILTEQEMVGVPLDVPLMWSLRTQLRDKIAEIDREIVPLIPEVALPKTKQPAWPAKQYKKDGTPTAQALRYYGEDFGASKEYRTDRIVRTAPINLSSDKQVKEYLLSIGWKPLEWNYKKGKDGKPIRDPMGNKVRTSPRLTIESLESCEFPEKHKDMGNKICERLVMAHRLGMVRGWFRDMRDDGRISAQAIPMGTPTGRMTHRQVVNVPGNGAPWGKELRSCYTTVPGYTRVGIDLVSCQIYGLAHYMRDEEYKHQVLFGDHHQYAADLANLADRQAGKKFNYSILFGASDEKLASDLGISKAAAAHARKLYFQGLPALDALIKALKHEWKQKGYITGLDGRAIWVRAEHMLLVYLLQALESIVMKHFIVGVYNQGHEAGLDFAPVTTMHDECQWLVKDEHVLLFQSICNNVIREINQRFSLWCEQAIDINVGKTWSECH